MLSWDYSIYWSEVGTRNKQFCFQSYTLGSSNTKLINKQKLYLIKGRGGNGEEVLQKKNFFNI